MRAQFGFLAVLFSCAAFAAVACSDNAPLTIDAGSTTGGAGSPMAAGPGAAGSMSAGPTQGAAGAPAYPTGSAGASQGAAGAPAYPSGSAGASQGGGGWTGAAGAIYVGAGGTVATGQAGTGDPGFTEACSEPTRPDGTCVAGAYKRLGVCACQDGLSCVCNDTCVDLQSDDNNCGACGIACGPTSTCQAGVCGPPVQNVVPPIGGCGSIDLAVSGDTLYWTTISSVTLRSLATGGQATISQAEKYASKIVAQGATAYWISFGNGIRKSVNGGAPTTVITAPTSINGLTVSPDGANIYFSTGTSVFRVPSTGGAAVEVAREVKGGIPRALALAGNAIVYPTDLNGDVDAPMLLDSGFATCGLEDLDGNVDMTTCGRLARSQGELFLDTIAVTPLGALWADGPNLKLEALSSSSRAFDDVAMTNNDPIAGFATNGKFVYFAESSPASMNGTIYRSLVAPNQVAMRIARGQIGARAVAIGPGKVYWSTSNCTIESTGL
jgi:hypothetical protein